MASSLMALGEWEKSYPPMIASEESTMLPWKQVHRISIPPHLLILSYPPSLDAIYLPCSLPGLVSTSLLTPCIGYPSVTDFLLQSRIDERAFEKVCMLGKWCVTG